MLAHLRHRKVIIDPGMAPALMVSKRVSKLSKSVSKLKKDSKSSSSFHSSLNSSNVHRHAIHVIFSTLLYFFDEVL